MQDLVIEWKEDGTHLYEQIYQYIRDEIRRGKLLCQEKLPSTRSLAEYLQVSRSTVELAYDQLVAEGYLEAVPYKGYFVARVEELYQMETAPDAGITSPAGRIIDSAKKQAAAFRVQMQAAIAFSFQMPLAHPKLHWTTRLQCRPFRSIFLQMRLTCAISRLIYGEKSTETF